MDGMNPYESPQTQGSDSVSRFKITERKVFWFGVALAYVASVVMTVGHSIHAQGTAHNISFGLGPILLTAGAIVLCLSLMLIAGVLLTKKNR